MEFGRWKKNEMTMTQIETPMPGDQSRMQLIEREAETPSSEPMPFSILVGQSVYLIRHRSIRNQSQRFDSLMICPILDRDIGSNLNSLLDGQLYLSVPSMHLLDASSQPFKTCT
jgi:hypothetical protein